jgi:uncharacterized protein YbjT (DUF2867 family)
MIVVIGGTGTTGRELVPLLQEARVPFRLMVRGGKAKDLRAQGLDVVGGDLDKPKTLPEALAGAEAVFLLSSPSPKVAAQHGGLAAAAKAAGVRRIVRLSAVGADPGSKVSLLRWHGEAERAVEATGVGTTHVRPHFFMQNFVNFYRDSIAKQDCFYLPLGNGTVGMVDVRDVALVAAQALTEERHVGKAYDVTGPEVLSMADAARSLSSAAGRPIRYVDVTPEAAKAGMVHSGTPVWLADGLCELFAAYAAGEGAIVSTAVLDVTGRMARSFSRFAHDHAHAWS